MSRLETDICIIGSGLAGAIIALECVGAGHEVTMLEAGAPANGRAYPLRLLEQIIRDFRIPRMNIWHRKARYKNADYQSTGNKKYSLRNLALVARGGSTLGWGGDAYRLKPEDFQLHSATGHGLDWPIGYDELEFYYSLAEQTIGVAGDHLDNGHPPRSTAFPLQARSFCERDEPFLSLLSVHGWSAMHHNISLATDGGVYTADILLNELAREPNFQLYSHCAAYRIICSSRDRARSVEFLDTI